MSYEAMEWAWALDLPTLAEKLVLVRLAWHADRHTGEAWPEFASIAKATGLSRRAVIYALKSLEAAGHITSHTRTKPGRGQTSNCYHLTIPGVQPLHSGVGAGVQMTTGRGATSAPEPSGNLPPPPPQGGAVPLPSDWQPSSQQQATLAGLYPGVNLDASLRRFRSHFLGRPDRTHPNWEARYDAWIAEDAADPGHGPARRRAKRAPAGPSRADRVREHNRLVLERAMAETDEVAEDHPRRLEPPRHAG